MPVSDLNNDHYRADGSWSVYYCGWAQRNPAPPKRMVETPENPRNHRFNNLSTGAGFRWPIHCMVYPSHVPLAICAQTVEILAFAELGRGSHKVTWGTPSMVFGGWDFLRLVDWLTDPNGSWIKPGFYRQISSKLFIRQIHRT